MASTVRAVSTVQLTHTTLALKDSRPGVSREAVQPRRDTWWASEGNADTFSGQESVKSELTLSCMTFEHPIDVH